MLWIRTTCPVADGCRPRFRTATSAQGAGVNYFRLRPCIGVGNKWGLGDVDHVDNFGAARIVSEEVKSRLERAGVTDVIFDQVG